MANVLIVNAHPLTAENSQTVTVLETFIEAHQASHPEDVFTTLDLYHMDLPEIDSDLLLAWQSLQKGAVFTDLTTAQQEKVRVFNEFTDQFLASQKIVIANALWNLNIPTRLKAWFDTINVAGKTFKYTADGPIGLVTDKKALHIQSSGGTYQGQDFSAQYVKGILNFIGITDFDSIYIEGADYDPEKAPEIMDKAKEMARSLAAQF
ncbi:FMN-dependent NADH-azoreductase [Enterococcus dongliensis]|uniref:FMN dependent NADH:quinone oxidoreductase n=1 Tax=Enterococcus dongliensis TaxID=2559925 RepID=A0AAP5NI40_9ENTE|nr:FMN-dependent NADH-azoreductase [Enterococcus dongliensis]MDT2595582.1 FMN-dependent NADH-azoreductase [Enterococcus dongliensis]MDT2603202.1 FMN-dependent NADH-azoreductase [Enterococcus dongliensis]MDT2633565.1 FMN-dependent NADH-azoreductase [Enterococcus dongliensis]MDT2636061.1 FMN-dependent NADH-azoreductase [Enterococcus dongliensis]MDT2639033.1 FMN-dependent NADH-azoreductase [Enterococcus dongliensis]